MEPGTPPLLTGSTSRLDCVLEVFDSLLLKNKSCEPHTAPDDAIESSESTEETAQETESLLATGAVQDHVGGIVNGEIASYVDCEQPEQPELNDAADQEFDFDECQKSPDNALEGGSTVITYPQPVDDQSSGFRLTSLLKAAKAFPSKSDRTTGGTSGNSARRRKTGNVAALDSEAAVPVTQALLMGPDCTSGTDAALPQPATEPCDLSTDSGLSETGDLPTPDHCDAASSNGPSLTTDHLQEETLGGRDAWPLPPEGARLGSCWGAPAGPRWRRCEPRPLSCVSTTSSSSSGAGSLPRAMVRRRNRQGGADDDCSATSQTGIRLSCLSSSATSIGSPSSIAPGASLTGLSQADRVVAEIVHTEAAYVTDLRQVIEGYIGYLRGCPDTTISDEQRSDLFSNFEDLFLCNSELLCALERCDLDPLRVARCFVQHQPRFAVYTDYCTNYPRTVSVLTELMRRETTARLFRERQAALGHTLPLGSYLLKPVQRILKYHLLLQSLWQRGAGSEQDRAATEEALQTMRRLADHINDMKRRHEHAVRVQEIQSLMRQWQGDDLTTYGELLAEETLRVPRARVPRHVFLFERMLLITKRQTDNTLMYKTHIMCANLMLIESVPGEACSLQVLPFDNPKLQYTLQARTVERKRQWALRLKGAILESYGADIPSHARELVMKLGQHREHGEGLRRRIGQRYHSVPDYLERRRVCKRPGLTARARRTSASGDARQQQERRAQIMFNNYCARRARWSVPNRPLSLPCAAVSPDHTLSSSTDVIFGADGSPGQFSPSISHCLPDLDEEGPDDVRTSCGDVTDNLHFTAVVEDADSPIRAAESRETVTRTSSTADLESGDVADLQTIVEQLVMQNKQFQRIRDRPRRDLRRSPTQSSSGTSHSERDSDSCLDLPTYGHEEASNSPVMEQEMYIHTGQIASCRKYPPVLTLESHTSQTSADDDTESQADCNQISQALNIKSCDNVDYVSLFDYGTGPVPVAVVDPCEDVSREVMSRSLAAPYRRVVRRIRDLHQAGQTEARHLLRTIRTRSARLSRHIEEESWPADTTLGNSEMPHHRSHDGLPRLEAVEDESGAGPVSDLPVEAGARFRLSSESEERFEERPSEARCSTPDTDKDRRPVWRCDVISDDEHSPEESDDMPSPSQIRWPTPREERVPSITSHRRSSGSRPRCWRPLSLIFEPQKYRQKQEPTVIQHAASLERLSSKHPAWNGRPFEEQNRNDATASYGPSLTSLRSDRRLGGAPYGGAVRWLGRRVLQLVLGEVPQESRTAPEPDRAALGARLASAEPPTSVTSALQSPLLSSSRPQLVRTDSVTSRGSSGAASDSISEGQSEVENWDDASGFYEHDMDILEQVDSVEVCW